MRFTSLKSRLAVLAFAALALDCRRPQPALESSPAGTANATSATSSRKICSTTTTPSPARTTARPPQMYVSPAAGAGRTSATPGSPTSRSCRTNIMYKHERAYYTLQPRRRLATHQRPLRHLRPPLPENLRRHALPDEQQHLGAAQRLLLSRRAVVVRSRADCRESRARNTSRLSWLRAVALPLLVATVLTEIPMFRRLSLPILAARR